MQAREPTLPFDALIELQPAGASVYEALLPDGWKQGRGLYGGLVTAVLVRGLERAAPGRKLRSLTAELCGPTQPGRAQLKVEALRVGSAVSTVAVRLQQDTEVQAHAVGVLGADRQEPVLLTQLDPPALGDWREAQVVSVGDAPFAPDFTRYFEFRTTSFPFSGAVEAAIEGWVRPVNPGVSRGAAYLAGCIDAYWPAEFMVMSAPRPMATIAFTFQPLGGFDGLDPDAPLFFRSKVVAARDGYAVENRELWGHDGRLLALNQQTMCTIK